MNTNSYSHTFAAFIPISFVLNVNIFILKNGFNPLSHQELSPTTDSNLVKSLMSLMDCLMDEFNDEAKIAQLEEREIYTWIEV